MRPWIQDAEGEMQDFRPFGSDEDIKKMLKSEEPKILCDHCDEAMID